MITGVHHFAMIVSSEKSIEFYSRLGFVEQFRKKREKDTIVLMEGYGIKLEMFIDPNHPEHAKDPENIGLRHLALKVDSCENIKKNFDCGAIMEDWSGIKFCFTKDPDGVPIEFHE